MTRLGLIAALVAMSAHPALAGKTACWFENNVVVVPAEVMGVAGDYILDTATAHTVLAETQAQAAGFAATDLSGSVRLAGLSLRGVRIAVAPIDLRSGALPTPIAGIIGADVLKDHVVDVGFVPCRVTIRAPGRSAPLAGRASLPLTWIAGRPVVRAAVADGPHAFAGNFTVATGGDTAVRLSDALAKVPGAAKPKELYPYGVSRPRLRAMSLAGALFEDLPSGLVQAEDPQLAGELGAPALRGWRLRFDFPAGRLILTPARPEIATPRGAKQKGSGHPEP